MIKYRHYSVSMGCVWSELPDNNMLIIGCRPIFGSWSGLLDDNYSNLVLFLDNIFLATNLALSVQLYMLHV